MDRSCLGARKQPLKLRSEIHDPEYTKKFAAVSKFLLDSKSLPESCKLDAATLSKVCWNLLDFMETSLGRDSSVATRQLTKLPTRAFRDFSPTGSLSKILLAALTHMCNAGWDNFDLTPPNRYDDGICILRVSEATLRESNDLPRPTIFLGKVAPESVTALTETVNKHGGLVVDSIEGASHVIEPDDVIDSLSGENTDGYLRIVSELSSASSSKAGIHWIFYPDSYDEFIDLADIDGDSSSYLHQQANDSNEKKTWRVCPRFILDCEIFNEWGNEVDYENETVNIIGSEDTTSHRTQRRFMALKMKIKDAESSSETMNVVDETVLVSSESTGEDEVESVANASADPSSSSASILGTRKKPDSGDDKVSDPLVPTNGKSRKSSRKSTHSQIKAPAWFSTESVNFLELKNLPEFFSVKDGASKTTEEYIKLRNSIVSLYSVSQSIYLSATECRKRIAGDVCVILKVHSFLDSFGVINFNVKSDCRPTLSHTMSSFTSGADLASSTSAGLCDLDEEEWSDEWTSEMDIALLHTLSESSGDWTAVSHSLKEGGVCGPSPLQCLARIVYLPSTAPSICGHASPSRSSIRSSTSTSKAGSRSELLSLEVAAHMSSALGCDAARQVVLKIQESIAKDDTPQEDSTHVDLGSALLRNQMKIALAVSAAAISALAAKDAEVEKARLKSLLADYIMHRMTVLDEKMKLLVEVDRMIDLEKERLDVDRRDTQIQRAQLAFKQLSQQGV